MHLYMRLNDIKNEINIFIKILNKNKDSKCNLEESDIRYIGKALMFLKKILDNDPKNEYFKLIIYAVFQMIESSIRNNVRNEKFNLYKRIYIENLFRYLLDVKSTRMCVYQMKEKLEEDAEIKNIINYFYSNHKNASGIIHVNNIKDIKINEYFLNIVEDNHDFDKVNYEKNKKNIIKLLKMSIEIMIKKQHKIVGQVFFNHMEILDYLIGKKYYHMYTNYLY